MIRFQILIFILVFIYLWLINFSYLSSICMVKKVKMTLTMEKNQTSLILRDMLIDIDDEELMP